MKTLKDGRPCNSLAFVLITIYCGSFLQCAPEAVKSASPATLTDVREMGERESDASTEMALEMGVADMAGESEDAQGHADAHVEVDGSQPDSSGGTLALLEPPDGKIYHGTLEWSDNLDNYVAALDDPEINPLVEGVHLGFPGVRDDVMRRA